MKPFISYLLILSLSLTVGCFNRDLAPVDAQQRAVDASGNAAPANWKACQTLYWTIGSSATPGLISYASKIRRPAVMYRPV